MVVGSHPAAIPRVVPIVPVVKSLSSVAIATAFLDVDGSPTAAYDNLALAVLCVVFMLMVLR